MIHNSQEGQSSFFGDQLYGKIVPKDHLLNRILKTIDFSFVLELCREAYCQDNGRPAYSPVAMFKIVFLQFLYDLSDHCIEDELNDRVSFRMFVGLDVDQPPPDHSTISRFRDRLGPERFKEIFNRVVSMAREAGIVSDKLHIMDSTAVNAKVDIYRIKKEFKDNDPDDYLDKHSPDKDARPGKTNKKKLFYGYKAHAIMDAESEIMLNVEATPGNARDAEELVPMAKDIPSPKVMTADKAYDQKENHQFLISNNIRNGIIPRKYHTKDYKKEHLKRVSNIARRLRPIIEHKLSEMKMWHGLRVARYIGLVKMRVQTYITAICVNVKRMIKLIFSAASPPKIRLRRVV